MSTKNLKKYLIAIFQDKHFTEARLNHVVYGNITLQLKLAKLRNKLSSRQKLKLSELSNSTVEINKDRKIILNYMCFHKCQLQNNQ